MRCLQLTVTALALVTTAGLSHGQIWNARNQAMGGTGVASSNYDAAATVNPALLTEFGERDDIALTLPVLGAQVSDKNDVVQALDDINHLFFDLEDQIDSGQTQAAIESAVAIIDGLSDVSGKPAFANLGGRIGVAIPGKRFAFAVDLRTAAEGGAIAIYDQTDTVLLTQAIATGDTSLLDDINSLGYVLGAAVTELSLAMATEFTPGDTRLSFGVTPKYQRVDTMLYLQNVNNFDSGDFEYDDYGNDDANFNLDLGAAWWFAEDFNIGLAVTNVLGNEYDTVAVEGYQSTYHVKPVATAAFGWNGDWFTFAFDADLNQRETFDELGESQFLRAGFEFNAADWAALRAGFRHDLEDSREDILTLGVGFSPFTVFHFDLTAMVGKHDTYGGVLELKFML